MSHPLLPASPPPGLLDDDAALAPAVAAIGQRHGLAGVATRRYDSGSLPVYALGDAHVLKLFPPDEEAHALIEQRALVAVDGRLPVPTPRVVASGDLDGWPYLLMTQLHGTRLVDAWPALEASARDRLADDLGAAVAALHALDGAALGAVPWHTFVTTQREGAAARQRERGLEERWVEQIDAFLDRAMPPPAPRLALLHTELMREHLLVEPARDGGIRLSGLFDFEPAMQGAPEYDFASLGLFVACGDARFLRRTLRAYGYAEAQLDESLQQRCMAYALLHRYSRLAWYLKRIPAPEARTLDQLAARWWAL